MSLRNASLILSVVLLIGCDDPRPPIRPPMPRQMPTGSWEGDTPFLLPGLKQPATVAADEAQLDDEVEVIGVSAGDKHRAYSLKAMRHLMSHVVNDTIDGVPVTITYCDRNEIGRCFTQSGIDGPLDVQLGGWKDQKILLKLKDRYYAHDAPDVPLEEFAFQRTTWGEWRKDHPDTDVYLTPPANPGEERKTNDKPE